MANTQSTIVHYVKHWDNNTKGYINADGNDLVAAIQAAELSLRLEAVEDQPANAAISSPHLFTITAARLDDDAVQSYAGYRSSI